MAPAATGEEVKLLGAWPSPFAMRAQIALNIKGVAYENLEEDLMRSKSELLLKSNPVYEKIPVLFHGEKTICESMIIVEYIDEAWATKGPSILPADPYDRAIARFWVAYIEDKWLKDSLSGILRGKTKEEKVEAAERAIPVFQQLEEALEKCSKGESFFGGENIGYVDIALGSYLAWIRVLEIMADIKLLDEAKVPLLVRWSERFCSHDLVKTLMPATDKLIEYAEMRQATGWNRNTAPSN